MAASAIHCVDAIVVAGPQNWNSGNCPNSRWSVSRSSGGCVQQSGSLRPSAGYIGRGVTV